MDTIRKEGSVLVKGVLISGVKCYVRTAFGEIKGVHMFQGVFKEGFQ